MEGKITEAYAAMGKADKSKKVVGATKAATEDEALDDKINAASRDIAYALNAGKCSYRY